MASGNRSKRGFAGMDPERQREIASRGGKARAKARQNEGGGRNS